MFLNSESCVTDLCLKVVVVFVVVAAAAAVVMWLMKSGVIQDSAVCLGC